MSNSSAGATISILWRPTLQNGILFWSANHIFFSLTGRHAVPDFALFETDFPAVETRKGHMLARANENASVLADFRGRAEVGGSGAHAHAVARLRLDCGAARPQQQQYLQGVRRGTDKVHGPTGSYFKLTRDVLCTAREMMRQNP